MSKSLEACDSIIKISSYELTGEIPVPFFKKLNEELQSLTDDILNEKTEITEQIEETLKKERLQSAVSEHGDLSEPTYYESLMEQLPIFSLYPKTSVSSTEMVNTNTKKISREESKQILEAIDKVVEEDINNLSQEIDTNIINKNYKKILDKLSIEKEEFIFKTNEKNYLSVICKRAYGYPPTFKFNETTGELSIKDRPQSRFHIDIITQNIIYNAPYLLTKTRDETKKQLIDSIYQKSQVISGLIKDFNINIDDLLLETNSHDTIEEYSNKIFSFFENLRNRASEAIKSNPISEEKQKILNKINIDEAELESKKIQSDSEVEKILSDADLKSRVISTNISEQEWKQFSIETKLFTDGVYNFTSTLSNPIFDSINVFFNNFISKTYTLLILLICIGSWRLGLVNAIINRIKKSIESGNSVKVLPIEQSKKEEKPIREREEEPNISDNTRSNTMTRDEENEFAGWQQNLRMRDRNDRDDRLGYDRNDRLGYDRIRDDRLGYDRVRDDRLGYDKNDRVRDGRVRDGRVGDGRVRDDKNDTKGRKSRRGGKKNRVTINLKSKNKTKTKTKTKKNIKIKSNKKNKTTKNKRILKNKTKK
jgi:hypothetical protein